MRRQQKSHALSERDRFIWQFIACYQAEHGFPPTRREIAAAFGMTVGGRISDALKRLAEHRAIALEFDQVRGIRLLRKPRYSVTLQFGGRANTLTVEGSEAEAWSVLDQRLLQYTSHNHIFYQDGNRITVRRHDTSFVAELNVVPA